MFQTFLNMIKCNLVLKDKERQFLEAPLIEMYLCIESKKKSSFAFDRSVEE